MRAHKRITVVGVATAVLVGGGIAFAGWMSSGTGDATPATAGSALALTVNVGTGATNLLPTQSVVVNPTVTNPNSYKVKLKTVSINSVTPDAAHVTAGCTVALSGASATAPTQAVIDALPVVSAGGTSAAIPITVALSAASDNACQGAQFTVNFTATSEASN